MDASPYPPKIDGFDRFAACCRWFAITGIAVITMLILDPPIQESPRPPTPARTLRGDPSQSASPSLPTYVPNCEEAIPGWL